MLHHNENRREASTHREDGGIIGRAVHGRLRVVDRDVLDILRLEDDVVIRAWIRRHVVGRARRLSVLRPQREHCSRAQHTTALAASRERTVFERDSRVLLVDAFKDAGVSDVRVGRQRDHAPNESLRHGLRCVRVLRSRSRILGGVWERERDAFNSDTP